MASREVDAHASEITRRIAQEPNRDQQEFVAIIYNDAQGSLRSTELFTSGSYQSAPVGKAIIAAGGLENVVGVVHNHPSKLAWDAENKDEALFINCMPSDGDWKTGRQMFGDRKDITYYVSGPDHVLRKYDYADNAKWDRLNEPVQRGKAHREPTLGEVVPLDLVPATQQPRYLLEGHARSTIGTLDALSPEAANPLSSPRSAPLHPLHEQAESAVRRLDAMLDKPFDAASACMAGSLACLAKQNGFERIDHALLSIQSEQTRAGEKVFIVQGDPSDPAKRRAHMQTQDAIVVPVEESLKRLTALEAASPQLAQSERLSQTQEQQAPRRTID